MYKENPLLIGNLNIEGMWIVINDIYNDIKFLFLK
jgi:hypothetical protein